MLSWSPGTGDVVAIMIPEPKGREIAALLDKNVTVTMHITIGTRNLQKYVSRTSVVFISISFIVLMIISLAWLVFYYIQRFRYASARDRNQQWSGHTVKPEERKRDSSGINRDASGINRDSSGINRDVSGINRDSSGIKRDASGINRDSSGINRDSSGIKRDVSGIKRDASGINRDSSGINRDVSGINSDVSGINRDVSGINSDVSGIKRMQHDAPKKENLERRLGDAAKKALNKLQIRTIRKGDKETESDFDNCAVCIEGYKPNDVVRILPCCHVFHKVCVDPWLQDHRTCPMCKTNILKALGIPPNADCTDDRPPDYEQSLGDPPANAVAATSEVSLGESVAVFDAAARMRGPAHAQPEPDSLTQPAEGCLIASSEHQPPLSSDSDTSFFLPVEVVLSDVELSADIEQDEVKS
ncbi:hypothetical protein P4O66_013921 [Electrophorus voltai]|uniref:RING-type domain-containing protein n=1 Tax=Electrophorus voltai TaxID=2609070 RepID=A0AAD8Z603_9TELE|nr:hypothetical protein P4O66_013921 [Electrophorus voltai]